MLERRFLAGSLVLCALLTPAMLSAKPAPWPLVKTERRFIVPAPRAETEWGSYHRNELPFFTPTPAEARRAEAAMEGAITKFRADQKDAIRGMWDRYVFVYHGATVEKRRKVIVTVAVFDLGGTGRELNLENAIQSEYFKDGGCMAFTFAFDLEAGTVSGFDCHGEA